MERVAGRNLRLGSVCSDEQSHSSPMQHAYEVLILLKGCFAYRERTGTIIVYPRFAVLSPEFEQTLGHSGAVRMLDDLGDVHKEKGSPKDAQGRVDEHFAFDNPLDQAAGCITAYVQAVAVARIGEEKTRNRFDVLDAIDAVCERVLHPIAAQVSRNHEAVPVSLLDHLASHVGGAAGVYFQGRYPPHRHVCDEGRDLLRPRDGPSNVPVNGRIAVDQRAAHEETRRNLGVLEGVLSNQFLD